MGGKYQLYGWWWMATFWWLALRRSRGKQNTPCPLLLSSIMMQAPALPSSGSFPRLLWLTQNSLFSEFQQHLSQQWWSTLLVLTECLLCARLYSKHGTWITMIPPHNHLGRQVLILSSLSQEWHWSMERLSNMAKGRTASMRQSLDLKPNIWIQSPNLSTSRTLSY